MRFPEEVLKKRMKSFQEKISLKGLDGVMLRTMSSYIYFTGIRWLRPALFIPREGDPIAFIARNEESGFMKKTWIKNIITYADGGDLIVNVTKTVREFKIKKIGMEFGLEKDAFILFYEMFKRLNRNVEVVDVASILAEMRMRKDDYELNAIRTAGKMAKKAMERALDAIEPGLSETEIAAEAYHTLYKLGSEYPQVYVNAGPYPRVHGEPHRDSIIKKNTFVTVVISADYNGYYSNMTRTIYVGDNPSIEAKKAMDCMDEVYNKAVELTRPERNFREVIKALDEIYAKYDLLDKRLIGYAHGVGLQTEEVPITTIVQAHRAMRPKPRMVLAMIHAPIMYDGLGQVKKEDTFIVNDDGTLENITA